MERCSKSMQGKAQDICTVRQRVSVLCLLLQVVSQTDVQYCGTANGSWGQGLLCGSTKGRFSRTAARIMPLSGATTLMPRLVKRAGRSAVPLVQMEGVRAQPYPSTQPSPPALCRVY